MPREEVATRGRREPSRHRCPFARFFFFFQHRTWALAGTWNGGLSRTRGSKQLQRGRDEKERARQKEGTCVAVRVAVRPP